MHSNKDYLIWLEVVHDGERTLKPTWLLKWQLVDLSKNILHVCRETINCADKLVAKSTAISSTTSLFCAFGISWVYQKMKKRKEKKGKIDKSA